MEAVGRYLLKSSDDQVLDQEIESKPRRPGEGKTVRLTRISLSFPNNVAQIWEPLKFDMCFKCLMPNYIFSLSVEVWRMDGSCAFTTDSEDDDMVLQMGNSRDGMASVLVPNPNLAPDRYVVRAVARSGGRVIDWIDEALTFDVLGKDQISTRVSERHLGNRARGRWNFIK
jgi:hypothetical protein